MESPQIRLKHDTFEDPLTDEMKQAIIDGLTVRPSRWQRFLGWLRWQAS